MKKVAFYTLGCKLNFSETSTIVRMFEENNYQKVEFQETADVYVVNTCSVTEHADKKCRKVVKEALKYSPNAFIVIVGCYAQLKPEEIAAIPGVAAVLGASEKFKLFELLNDFKPSSTAVVHHSPISEVKEYYCSYSINDRTRTFLKVQDGCDYSCTFCTIPLARGKSRSDSISNVVATAQELIEKGVKEIVLTGVNIGDFGLINNQRVHHFIDLIKALDQIQGQYRYRISSIEPNLLSDEIIQFVATSKHFAPHFHIPLQSGSNTVLKKMKRRYLRELYTQRIEAIKSSIPHACIGVDVITGFPGESDLEFKETYEFLTTLDISYLHVFTYSERANTEAIGLKGKVSEKIKGERTHALRNLSEKKRRGFYEHYQGTVREVLFESEEDEGIMRGFTDNYIKVKFPYDPLLVNEFVPVKLKQIHPDNIYEVVQVITLPVHS
ncbi:MAG TPA: tRNA (N(6)-L-threonylcarbamoyladenosine(37)-C(2))-methylthiotransferase MtaB [Cytophagaceae bacterium]|nr:tRNA (N(6)-L-threonylcarbamoyladenosine(37)-C(2))-methylthiotransferase MtaB [Cytophagaceae bacterium]